MNENIDEFPDGISLKSIEEALYEIPELEEQIELGVDMQEDIDGKSISSSNTEAKAELDRIIKNANTTSKREEFKDIEMKEHIKMERVGILSDVLPIKSGLHG